MEAVRIALQIASALEAAHERGILHRDLKPANVMVLTRGEEPTAKLLDFGIARMFGAAVHVDATQSNTGGVIGTPAYMSPEQAQGKPLDARSDIFSFGSVLYELIAGTRPFAGDSTAEVLSAVLRDEPRPLAVAADLQQVVTRCLSKDPARRYQSMADVSAALRRVTPANDDAPASIAVLPFANLSADKENEYFADGLAEEIINALAQVEGLKVIARTSAFSFKGRNEDIRHIAQALGVTNVLEGSVRKAGDRIRVTAQLIAATDGTHLWSERFDRALTDVFAVQDEIAAAITTSLKGRLSAKAPAARRHTPSVAAYDSFLKGRAHLAQFTPDAWHRAKVHFEQAIALDPVFGEPHAELALGHFIIGMHGMRPMREAAPIVRAEVERAMTLSQADPRPRFLLGAVALAHDYDWESAETHFKASLGATDVSAYARWIHASLYLRGLGRLEESSVEMTRAVELDPLNATWHAILSAHLVDTGRYDEAIHSAERAVELSPGYVIAMSLLGEACWAAGRKGEAVAALERAYAIAPWSGFTAGWLAGVLWQMGERDRAETLIRETGDEPGQLWGRVVYHLLSSDLDGAAVWYERMIERRDPFALIYAWARITQPLREHPGWSRLAGMMRLR
jgi:serine/threonine-protein kinase